MYITTCKIICEIIRLKKHDYVITNHMMSVTISVETFSSNNNCKNDLILSRNALNKYILLRICIISDKNINYYKLL